MIRVHNLVAAYGKTEVLHGVSLSVEPQEILVIMGQSGCGKSTFMRHLIGLQRPVSGAVEVNGQDLAEMSFAQYREFCRSVGVLFQSGGLFNSMTVAENVGFPLREHTRLADPVIEITVSLKLQQVGLAGTEKLMPAQLSGGMKKRAGLARALALDPNILFLDEPTTGLDPIIGAGIDELILKIRALYRATIVVVAHDIAGSMHIADRIAMFKDGIIIEVGTPAEVRASDDDYVRRFLERRPEETQDEGF